MAGSTSWAACGYTPSALAAACCAACACAATAPSRCVCVSAVPHAKCRMPYATWDSSTASLRWLRACITAARDQAGLGVGIAWETDASHTELEKLLSRQSARFQSAVATSCCLCSRTASSETPYSNRHAVRGWVGTTRSSDNQHVLRCAAARRTASFPLATWLLGTGRTNRRSRSTAKSSGASKADCCGIAAGRHMFHIPYGI